MTAERDGLLHGQVPAATALLGAPGSMQLSRRAAGTQPLSWSQEGQLGLEPWPSDVDSLWSMQGPNSTIWRGPVCCLCPREAWGWPDAEVPSPTQAGNDTPRWRSQIRAVVVTGWGTSSSWAGRRHQRRVVGAASWHPLSSRQDPGAWVGQHAWQGGSGPHQTTGQLREDAGSQRG